MPSKKPPSKLSEEAFAVLFDAQATPGLVMDAGWHICFVNRAAVATLGYEPDELIGLHIDQIVPEELRDRYKKLRDASADAKASASIVMRGERIIQKKDGTELPVELRIARVVADGVEYRISTFEDISQRKEAIGLSYDITMQRHAEDELAAARRSLSESEEKFRKAFAASANPIAITDMRSGTLLEVNEAFERVFGHSREQALGRTTIELGLWGDPTQRAQMVALLRDKASFRNLEIVGGHRDGRRLSLILSGELIEIGGRSCLVTYVNDMTERDATKRALLESEELFARAFRAGPDALTILDVKSGVFIEVNEGFERVFARSRADVIGRTSLELDLWADPLERERARTILNEKRSLRDFPIVARRPNGELRDCSLSAEYIELASGLSVLAIVRDVTETARIERAKADLENQLRQAQKMDALGTLAGGIAHDFNNILGAIMAYSELIKLDINLPDQIESYLVELRRAGDRAKDLVQQILTFSRRQPQQRRPMKPDVAVREALNLLRSSLPSTIRIDVRIHPEVPLVLADPTQMHQVITNLGTNAAHAMRLAAGQLTIELDGVTVDATMAKAHSDLQPRRYARITVSDTGEGISNETLKHMFEPFFTTKGPGEGTGLGLAVVHGIVREHEGAILVDSERGEGTTISIYLPEHEVELADDAEPRAGLQRANGESVLFIDDEAVLCRSVAGLLERLGYQVTARSDPAEALELFRQKPAAYDVVLTDLTMPGLTGVDIAREVLKLAPSKPVLLMSGFNSSWTAEALKTLGVVDLIPKPLGAARLSESLAAALGKTP
jgi:PAS domain S-box-containing protein